MAHLPERLALGLAVVVLVFAHLGTAEAQMTTRPGTTTDHPHDLPWDVSGRSLKAPRIRTIAGPDTLPGTAAWLVHNDPFAAWSVGRSLTMRTWRRQDGAFGETGKLVGFVSPRSHAGGGGGTLPRDDVASCATCHNVPFGEPGAGTTIAKDAGTGRNTPHLFGGGLIEMIGERIGAHIMATCDDNRDGVIGFDEGGPITIVPVPDGTNELDLAPIELGHCRVDKRTGRPAVDEGIRPIYLDARRQQMTWATSARTPGTAGWIPEVHPFGHGQKEGGLGATVRGIFIAAADVHTGLQARDLVSLDDPDGDGLAGVSLTGGRQFLTAIRPRDRGKVSNANGLSLDDPDRDGYAEELTTGDLDLAEFFLFHMPQPAERPSPQAARGRAVFERVGCARCHVPDWALERDRRLFVLEHVWVGSPPRLTGRLRRQFDRPARRFVPVGAPIIARGVYSDFRRHDLGAEFHEVGFDGAVIRRFRTTPLWGVGSTGPWGHDGRSLTLEHVIHRHGGDAESSRDAYEASSVDQRRDLLAFLRSLVLYEVHGLPTDVDASGSIEDEWFVAGRSTGGPERFDPELLAAIPCQIEGPTVGFTGETLFSRACTNVPAMYRTNLAARRDSDGDSFPDLLDACPRREGWKNGCD